MKPGACLLVALLATAQPCLARAAEPVRIELNALDAAQDRCRASFVIENKAASAIDSLKLDLVIFGKDGAINQRLVLEMGPLRAAKTVVKTFELNGDCARVGSILLNEVTACSLTEPNTCLDRLVLTSRIANIRFFK
jgi:hypothetical protein